ncbi:MAG: hypothetical protein IPK16_05415 [Anaerolineales bacterium]|nr:hypothetical protein [Anaerolineales bacterium]
MLPTLLTFSIADIPVTLRLGALDCERRRQLVAQYGSFATPATDSALRVDLQVVDGAPFITPEGQHAWQVITWQEGDRIRFRSFYEEGWIARDQRVAHLDLRAEGDPENFLRVLYAWECLAHGGLLLHASGIVRNGLGFVFFGHSGAGKTTIAGLSAPAVVLSDDLVMIRPMADRVVVFGAPFAGALPETAHQSGCTAGGILRPDPGILSSHRATANCRSCGAPCVMRTLCHAATGTVRSNHGTLRQPGADHSYLPSVFSQR